MCVMDKEADHLPPLAVNILCSTYNVFNMGLREEALALHTPCFYLVILGRISATFAIIMGRKFLLSVDPQFYTLLLLAGHTLWGRPYKKERSYLPT